MMQQLKQFAVFCLKSEILETYPAYQEHCENSMKAKDKTPKWDEVR
jgi:hypothetical protein